jgi:hypothetical protein
MTILDARRHDHWLEQRLQIRAELARRNRSHYWLARTIDRDPAYVYDALYRGSDSTVYLWFRMAEALGMKWTLAPRSPDDPA